MEYMDIGVIGHNEKRVCEGRIYIKSLKKRGKRRIKITGGAKSGVKFEKRTKIGW